MSKNLQPIILSTDIGLDPDDSVALILAAYSPEIKLELLLIEEGWDKRYELAQKYISSMNCKTRLFHGSEHIYGLGASFNEDYMKEVDKVIENNNEIFYVGIGQLNNLANYLKVNETNEEKMEIIRKKLTLFQMGGSAENKPSWNFIANYEAAKYVFSQGIKTYLVTKQVTNNEKISINTDSEFYKAISISENSSHKLLSQQIKDFNKFYLHDPLTLASVFLKKLIKFKPASLEFKNDGLQTFKEDKESRIHVSVNANYNSLIKILEERVIKIKSF